MSASYSCETTPDWNRLQKALAVEAERGFNNIEGRQQRFSEFLQSALSEPPEPLAEEQQGRWRSLSQDYARYPELSFADRQHLVAETRRTIYATRRSLEQSTTATDTAPLDATYRAAASSPAPPASAPPATTLFRKGAVPDLEQPVTYLKGVGPKNAERLAKLGI
ncbi:MAG: DNA helicase RecG, partial [Cyanobacteria bacterium J06626_18]